MMMCHLKQNSDKVIMYVIAKSKLITKIKTEEILVKNK